MLLLIIGLIILLIILGRKFGGKAARKVTGETRRRELVDTLKQHYERGKTLVGQAVEQLNIKIHELNENLKELNIFRKAHTDKDIDQLQSRLSVFGNCRPRQAFAEEVLLDDVAVSSVAYEKTSNFLAEVDGKSNKDFWAAVVHSPFGIRKQIQNECGLILAHIEEFDMLIEEMLRELQNREFYTETEVKVCQVYLDIISFISQVIQKQIIPEFDLIKAFYEAEQLKNLIIAEQPLCDPGFLYNITMLVGTPYERHYRFVKNAYAFYIISCRIFDTPILTNLFEHDVTEKDYTYLVDEKKVLYAQMALIEASQTYVEEKADGEED